MRLTQELTENQGESLAARRDESDSADTTHVWYAERIFLRANISYNRVSEAVYPPCQSDNIGIPHYNTEMPFLRDW